MTERRLAAWVGGICKTCGAYTHSCKCEHQESKFASFFAAPREGAGSPAGPAANGEPAGAAPSLRSENAGTDHQAVGESAPAVTGGMKSSLQAGTVKRAIDRTDGAESAESEAVQSAEAPISDILCKLDAARIAEGNVAGGVVPWPLARSLLLDAVSVASVPSSARVTIQSAWLIEARFDSDGLPDYWMGHGWTPDACRAAMFMTKEAAEHVLRNAHQPEHGQFICAPDVTPIVRQHDFYSSLSSVAENTPRLDVGPWRAFLAQHREQWDGRRAHQLTFKQLYELANEADVIIGQLERESAWRLAELRAIHDVLDKHGFTHHGLQLSRVIEALCEESLPSATAAAPGRSAA